ncbi:MAG: ATP-binding protein [Syntrophobacteraceae bacterium]|nr:ATP-binding protein [Syntrophobacteraceae bacterium]
MNEKIVENLTGEEYASKIFEMSGAKFDPEIASELWAKIQQHKWLLSERLSRDVGARTACIDFLENMDQAVDEYLSYKRQDVLNELGAQTFGREIWDTISDSQPPKQLVNRRIILPLTMEDLSRKHGVSPPRTIIFFGPPGTGKTHFVKAIAGVLSWWFIEIAPSMLMEDGAEKMGANLRRTMEKVRQLQDAVIFIDEFEELASCRDEADRLDKCITNEFLKQVPLFKNEPKRLLLVCATNYIRHLDQALLRPGRFDCIIPVGGLNSDERRAILDYYLSRINVGQIDARKLVAETSRFTPADIEYLFEQVAQYAFEREVARREDYKVTTEDFLGVMARMRPTLTDEIIDEFEKDSVTYARV